MNAARILAGVATVVAAVSASALDRVWVNGETSAKQAWRTVENWTDPSGVPATDFPKAAGDTATLTAPSDYRLQTIYTGGSDSGGYGLTLDSVTGSAQHTINFGDSQTIAYTSQNNHYLTSDQKLALTNPTGFLGYWMNNIGRLFFSLKATAQNTPVLHALSLAGRPGVEVPTAGTTAVVGNVYESGALVKTGSGDLRIDTLDSGTDTIYVNAGSLTLGGECEADVTALLQRAAVRFDASATNTLVTQVGADGLTAVTRWNDANGGNIRAMQADYPGSAPFLSFARSPFLSAVRSPTGLPYVDFGARLASDVAELGPTNCNLRLTARLTTVREIFIAADYPKSMIGCTAVGDMDTYHLVPDLTYDQFVQFGGGDKQFNSTKNGDLTLNCMKVTSDGCRPSTVTGLNVLSISPLANIAVQTLGTGCCRTDYNGGLRLGEAIVFTNVLSRAERTLLNRYLMRKWKGQGADRMAGNVFVATADTPIGVPAGKTAHVAEVVATAGALTKAGDGTLVIDRLSPGTTKVMVKGGAVGFGSVSVPAKQVPGNPYIWLDARKIDPAGMMVFDGNPTNYVHSWIDCRDGVSTAATGLYSTAPRMAYVEKDAVGPGLPAISFGLKAWGNHSHMQFPNWTSGSARAGFAVVRPLATNVGMPLFGSSMLGTIREVGRIAHRNTIQPNLTTARWAINGVPVDPMAALPELSQNKDFFLISFTADRFINIGGIAGQRTDTTTYSNECGGWEVAEMIVYNTALTEAERRETEAYLLDRWFGKAHPADSAPRAAAVTYASGVDPVLGADGDASVSSVSAEGGTLTKRGAGTLTLDGVNGVSAIDVAEGSLLVNPTTPDSFGPNLHFDAMRADSLTTSVSSDGTLTNVTAWTSTVDGKVAQSRAGDANVASGYLKHPTLHTVETPSGARRVIDFGTFVPLSKISPEMDSAAMSFATVSAAEAHVVLADKNGGLERQCVLISSSDLSWLRGYNGAVFDNTYKNTLADTRNGYIAINGVKGDADSKLPTGLDLVSLAPLSKRPINWICNDRGGSFGGLQVGEEIAYATALTDAQRAYVQDYLQWKWRGGAAPVWTNAYDSICVAAGSSLSLAQSVVRTPAVSGGGTIAADLADVAAVSLDWTESTDEHLTVNGEISFASAVTVRIVAGKKLPYGDHVLLSASSISGFDASAWSLATDSQVRGGVSFFRNGSDILLRHDRPGLSVIIK